MPGFDALLREALVIAALLSLPVLCVAALAGTAVAVVQAATQVQEQTLTMLPKVVAVGAFVVLFGAFGMQACVRLFHDVIAAIPSLVAGG